MWKRSLAVGTAAVVGFCIVVGFCLVGCGATEAEHRDGRSLADDDADSGVELDDDATNTDAEPNGGPGGNDDPPSDDTPSDDNTTPSDNATPPTRVVLGCQAQPLTLGPVSDAEAAQPQIVWTGRDFGVGWSSANGYTIRITSGFSTSNSLTLPPLPDAASPQLFWTGTELELYYALQDSIYVDTLSQEGTLSVAQTRLVAVGSSFRAVEIEPGNVAVLTNSTLYLNGAELPMTAYGIAAAGWNGESFLYSNSLGHGEWTLYGLNADGSPDLSAMDLSWNGLAGTGRAAGSDFASSADTGRHAVVVAAGGTLSLAIEGLPLFKRALLQPEADASLFFDGELYVALLANGLVDEEAANRDIGLLAFTADGVLLSESESLTVLSDHVGDERFPVGASAEPGDFAVVWIQDGELVAQRCAMTVR